MKVPDSEEEFLLHPATVRRNDRSAQSVVCMNLMKKKSNFPKFQYGTIGRCDEVLFIGTKFIMDNIALVVRASSLLIASQLYSKAKIPNNIL